MPRPQFSLRTLLAALGVLSVCFAFVAMRAFLVLLLAVIVLALLAVRYGIAKRQIHYVMVGTITAIAATVLLLFDRSFGYVWDGHIVLNCDVVVLDAASGFPIPEAKVGAGEEFSAPLPWDFVAADAFGRANLLIDASTGGYVSGLGIPDRYPPLASFGTKTLYIGAPNYESKSVVLAATFRRSAWPTTNLHLPQITVRLTPLEASAASTSTSPQSSPPLTPTTACPAPEHRPHSARAD
jgi:hypothetical protein